MFQLSGVHYIASSENSHRGNLKGTLKPEPRTVVVWKSLVALLFGTLGFL